LWFVCVNSQRCPGWVGKLLVRTSTPGHKRKPYRSHVRAVRALAGVTCVSCRCGASGTAVTRPNTLAPLKRGARNPSRCQQGRRCVTRREPRHPGRVDAWKLTVRFADKSEASGCRAVPCACTGARRPRSDSDEEPKGFARHEVKKYRKRKRRLKKATTALSKRRTAHTEGWARGYRS
jgi:hypothetical protein